MPAPRTQVGRLTGYMLEAGNTPEPEVTLVVTVGADPGRRVEVPLDTDGWEFIRRIIGDEGNS